MDKEDHSNEVAILAAGGGDAVAVLGELKKGTKKYNKINLRLWIIQ